MAGSYRKAGHTLRIEFRILGPLEVRTGNHALPLGGSKQRALLAELLLHANEVVSSERLIDELWGEDPPDTAPKMIQNYVSQLRKVLRPELLVTRASGYALQVAPDELDARHFERLVTEGREALARGDTRAAAELLREGLALWRGPALADFVYEPFAETEIGRLEELRLTAIEDRIEADLALGRHGDVIGELEALIAHHPHRERLRGHLMLALYRSGRQAEALDVYARTRRRLDEELGIEPSPALQRLERAILLQDPSLELEPATAPGTAAAAEAVRARPPRETRKMVSVLCAEIVSLGNRHDPEALRRLMGRSSEAVEVVLARHGGRVQRLLTGPLVAVFGVPSVHEDDPLRAVRAAVEVRETLAELSDELERDLGARVAVRAGVETGEVLAYDGSAQTSSVTGDVVNRAARLEQAARPGEILIGGEIESLVRSSVRVEAMEGGDGEQAWRLLEVTADATAIPRRLDAPMVGREHELARLRQAFDRVVLERTSYLFTLLGAAGIGKSRLAQELASSLAGEARALVGRCLPYGEGITFWPLGEVVRRAAGDDVATNLPPLLVDDPDAALVVDRIAGAIGLSESTGTSEETFWAARKLFESLARERPLVLVFDDLHWAEPTFLDLIEHVADWTRDAPILLVGLARPELLEERPSWAGGKLNATSLLLEPLTESESETLMANLPAAARLAGEDRARIAEAAEGNPLFLEQMLAMVSESGSAGGDLRVPPTIQALLAARLDRLDPDERAVLERASIVGKEFSRASVLELAPEAERESSDRHLQMLVRRELIRPDLSPLPGDDGFRFRHILIREAAYDSVPKEARAQLHERFADWLELTAGERAREYEELLGYHLERAYLYRTELGLGDGDLAARAAERLASAGRRAYARGDVPAAVGLLSRASALLAEGAPGRLELLTDLAEALRETGDFERAEGVLTEVIEAAAAAGEDALEAYAVVIRLRLRLQTQVDPTFTPDEIIDAARRAIRLFEELGDERRLARAWFVLAWAPWLQGRVADAEEALQRAIAYARRAGDERTEAQSLNLYVGSGLFGPIPVPDAVRRCEEILARPPEQQRISASAYRALAGLKAMQGEFEEARSYARRDRAILEDLGLTGPAAVAAEVYGLVELFAGDPVAAERELRRGYETLDQAGARSILSNLSAMLAQALYAQGRDEEALAFSETAEQVTPADDLAPQVQWRAARAKVLARLGRTDEATAMARDAVALAEGTPDFLLLHADALVDLAEVLRLANRPDDAVPVAEHALRLYERKACLVSAANTRDLLARLSAPTPG